MSIAISEEDDYYPSFLTEENKSYISPNLVAFLLQNNNRQLEELIYNLIHHKKESEKSIEANIIYNPDSINNSLYISLEALLLQAAYITTKEVVINKIAQIYSWFQEKRKVVSPGFILDLPKETVNSPKQKKPLISEDAEDTSMSPNSNALFDTEIKYYGNKKKGLFKTKQASSKKSQRTSNFANYTSFDGNTTHSSMNNKKLTIDDVLRGIFSPTNPFIQTNKSCYSTQSHPFNYDILTIDNQIENIKRKQLHIARTKDEIKSIVNNQFNPFRFKEKGTITKRNEMKTMINYYQQMKSYNNNIKLIQNKDSCNNSETLKSNVFSYTDRTSLKEYSEIMQRRKPKVYERLKSQLHKTQSLISFNSYKLRHNNQLKTTKETTFIQDEKTTEKTIDLKVKLDPLKIRLFDYQKVKQFQRDIFDNGIINKAPSESLLYERFNQKGLLNIKEESLKKDELVKTCNSPLSGFDITNLDSMLIARKSINSHLDNKDKENAIKDNVSIDPNDFLQLRQSIANKHKNEFSLFKKNIKIKKSMSQDALFHAYISPKNETIYPRSFLPYCGSGLLSNPNM